MDMWNFDKWKPREAVQDIFHDQIQCGSYEEAGSYDDGEIHFDENFSYQNEEDKERGHKVDENA